MNGDSFFSRHPGLAEQISRHLFNAVVIYSFESGEPASVYANPLFYKLTGASPDDIIGKPPQLSFNHSRTPSDRYLDFMNHVLERKPVHGELQLFTENEQSLWVTARSVPLTTPGQNPPALLVVLNDLTQLKKKERELEQAQRTADESARVKEKFLAKMSHEMRTPINAVLGMAQLLEDTPLNQKQKEFVEELRLSSENLLAMVNDILEFNMIDSGGLQLNHRPFNIRKQLQLLVDKLTERAKEKGLSMELVISEKAPEKVGGDPVRLSQILMNLIANAIKFTKYGGVKVLVRSEEHSNEKVLIEIKVKDTGIGISPELMSNIFENFPRASGITNYTYGTTGLGLSLANELTRYMGGKLDVESVVGTGSVFTVSIPFEKIGKTKESGEAEPSRNKTDDDKSLEGKRILVVDDYMVNRRIVKGMLEKEGCSVDQAADGETGLKMIREGEYDIVFMDVQMQGMDGLDVTRKVREEEAESGRHLPIVAITASVLDKDIIACREAGMDHFIGKPFNKNDLIEAVKTDYSSETTAKKTSPPETETDSETDIEDRINLSVLSEMAGGNREMMDDMIDLFKTQTPELLRKADDEIRQGEFLAAGKTVHTLKPTFTYMGLDRAFNLSAEIERLAADHDENEEVDADTFREKFAELKTGIENALSKIGS
ncbi:PAS domain-containing hybrid sensor histidine kinase/response regulator [Rhodohalobacter mucosus]|uniref:histidine kinase n=1 Tax=Rhodohalobacter mucosus TaxID=2079485 RepID=A0A316TXH6_9BACT|nr:PAS domain-containing hybrid sensor histidine kinase/response regulator [Rhodohalobacter mucosus]PWN07362.1 hypothetical protein DDZ15_03600 [Rhodohalobacter mucosus]